MFTCTKYNFQCENSVLAGLHHCMARTAFRGGDLKLVQLNRLEPSPKRNYMGSLNDLNWSKMTRNSPKVSESIALLVSEFEATFRKILFFWTDLAQIACRLAFSSASWNGKTEPQRPKAASWWHAVHFRADGFRREKDWPIGPAVRANYKPNSLFDNVGSLSEQMGNKMKDYPMHSGMKYQKKNTNIITSEVEWLPSALFS